MFYDFLREIEKKQFSMLFLKHNLIKFTTYLTKIYGHE